MTAQQMIDRVAKQISNLKVGDTSVQANKDTLLEFLNLAKDQIAIDTLLWLSGEVVAMTTATEYTLVGNPVQIIDIYDDSLNLRFRNSPDTKGYYQLSPQVISINEPEDGGNLNINYYYYPTDYIVTDDLDIPPSLYLAMYAYMKHLAYAIYTSEKEQLLADKQLSKYETQKNKFLGMTDTGNVDTLLEVDLISSKNLV